MYVYHYYAIFQPTPGEVAHLDGVILRNKQFNGDWSEYQELKKDIFKEEADRLTICSLTLVGQKE